MARISSLDTRGSDPSSVNLHRLLTRLERTLLSPEADLDLLRSSHERARVAANFEYARSLLLRLEHESASIKIASRKQAVQADLQSERELLRELQSRLQELNQLDDESEEESEDGHGSAMENEDEKVPSYAPAIPGATNSIDTEPTAAQDAAAHLASSLRSRNNPQTKPSSVATGSSLFPKSEKDVDIAKVADEETILGAHRAEQEDLTASLLALAKELKLSANTFSTSLEAEKGSTLNRATKGLDSNVDGMSAAQTKMGALRRMTEGRGWWGRMIMYGYIAGLWLLALVIVFVLPKLRF